MLKGIPSILSPELLKILMEMGHGDEIIIGDGNFPAASCAQRLVRLDGHGGCEVLDAILKLFPLDTFVEKPVSLMAVVNANDPEPYIWGKYMSTIKKYDDNVKEFEFVERYKFYERTKMAYAVIATSEAALCANIILKKGIIEG